MTAGETHTWSTNSHLPYYAEVDGFLMSLPDGFTLSPDMSGWLVLVFTLFGLSVRGNSVVYVIISMAALSLSAAVWLIMELDNPLSGQFGISSAALREALFHMDAAF